MAIVQNVFLDLLTHLVELWNTCLNDWGIFGTWLISFAILRKIAKTFNKLKS